MAENGQPEVKPHNPGRSTVRRKARDPNGGRAVHAGFGIPANSAWKCSTSAERGRRKLKGSSSEVNGCDVCELIKCCIVAGRARKLAPRDAFGRMTSAFNSSTVRRGSSRSGAPTRYGSRVKRARDCETVDHGVETGYVRFHHLGKLAL